MRIKTCFSQALFRWLACLVLGITLVVPHAAHGQDNSSRPGALLVRFRANASIAQARAALPDIVALEAQIAPASFSLRVPAGAEERYLAELSALPQIAYAQLDHRVAAQALPNDPRYAEQWDMARIGMPAAWDVITDTAPVIVATLDTGVRLDHPDLQSRVWRNTGEIGSNGVDDDGNGYADDLNGWHFYHIYSGGQATPDQNPDVADPHGHGTHVAGVIAAAGDNTLGITGVAWRTQLMPVRVLDQDGLGWESDIIQGIDYAVANGARVINMSLGLSNAGPALAEAVARAEAHGALLVAAAGNNGGAVLYPAAYPSVLSVGASDQQDRRAGFSAYGKRLDLLAPGVDILSTWNGLPYFVRSGTSMAAPHVAGVAALLMASTAGAGVARIRACLLRSAADLGEPGWDAQTGFGLLNAAHASRGCAPLVYLPLAQAH
ncbi:MAG TPA: S8 family peptidase [Roseiflexaceae bacterium]|nr:S8 family peptidase [Roseiflexaceae bacterium]